MEQWRNELYHHGIKGQKWGVRRFQNKDGSLTGAGEKRYGGSVGERIRGAFSRKSTYTSASSSKKVAPKDSVNAEEQRQRRKKWIKRGAIAAGAVVAAYAGYKAVQYSKAKQTAKGRLYAKAHDAAWKDANRIFKKETVLRDGRRQIESGDFGSMSRYARTHASDYFNEKTRSGKAQIRREARLVIRENKQSRKNMRSTMRRANKIWREEDWRRKHGI